MKTIQIEIKKNHVQEEYRKFLKEVGIKRVHSGWYTVDYNGVDLDCSNIISAKRNKFGMIID